MTRLALCLLLLATGASAAPLPYGVRVFHDDERGATCWIYQAGSGAGISCIPDSQLQAGNQRELSPHETQPEPTPALAPGRWIDERYQL
ncbi:hypothetical protein I8746_05490 [Pseudomonas sp. USTB-Z]|uniref:hypothetical protein n=1 Tax=unclassified Pseudomonas TaxID=196821 RepID=UPI001C83EB19|nr:MULTISPECIES: hypothetical protein [unclassified Pseudomonas]MBX6689050.1 hypothetical protein [Pseudomonas sp. USTB-Z]MEB3438573.1 hypothetical protein [Pseudomonas sp. A2]HEN8732260.1 hypothetical protein [Pseudomonas putida]